MTIPLLQTVHDLGLQPLQGIVQVGASFGQEIREFAGHGFTRGVFIEPLLEPFNALATLCKQYPNYVAVNALCTSTNGKEVEFFVASNGGQSSSAMKPLNHLDEFSYVRFDQKIKLVGHQLDAVLSFLRQNGHSSACEKPDLLYMDTQGSELEVLKGATSTLAAVDLVITEVTRNQMYEGAPSLAELTSFLNAHDFALNNVNFNGNHHADALFIKRARLRLKTGF